jgi:alpha-L-rhamnosidase
MEILSRYGFCQQVIEEMKAYFDGMARTTGTLWEHNTATASCNHGFASHVAHNLFRDVLGAYEVNTAERVLRLRLPALDLAWCEGSLPTPDGFIHIAWNRTDGKLNYEVQAPAGYRTVPAG